MTSDQRRTRRLQRLWGEKRAEARRKAMENYALTETQLAVLASLGDGWTAQEPDSYDRWGLCDADGHWYPETTAWNGRVGTDSDIGEVYFYHAKS